MQPVGVITVKNIIIIIIGEIIFPKIIPNLNHILFNGVKIFEFSIPNVRNKNEIIINNILIFPLFSNGYKPIAKKMKENATPKLLLELLLELLFIIEFIIKIFILFNFVSSFSLF